MKELDTNYPINSFKTNFVSSFTYSALKRDFTVRTCKLSAENTKDEKDSHKDGLAFKSHHIV